MLLGVEDSVPERRFCENPQKKSPQLVLTLLKAKSRHHERIGIHASLEGIPSMGSFGLKAELLIQANGLLIVGIDAKLTPPEPQTIVCGINQLPQQGRPHAFDLVIVTHSHPECG